MLRTASFATLVVLSLVILPTSSADVCRKAKGCMFWDEQHHEYILYEVDTSSIDVLVYPPATPFAALGDIDVVAGAVEAWDAGIDALGPAWLASGVDVRTYVVGVDLIPPEALADPEIHVVTAEFNPFVLFGIGLQVPIGVCAQQGGPASTVFEHSHGDVSAVRAVQCETGGLECVALNTNFLLGGANQLYDLVAHEVGHCLGIGHVGDALDFSAKTVPLSDIMSYANDPDQVHCVSTLNIRAFEAVYAPLLGQPGGQPADTYVHQAASAYDQVSCPNP
jgi:hypothetical protein